MPARTDDLLRPTLDPDLDVRAFGRLFRPQSILWPTFFGGPVAGGVLFGINYARMGRRDLARWCWVGGVALALVLAVLIAWYLAQTTGASGSGAPSSRRMIRFGTSAVSVAVGWFLAQHQARRYGAWENAGNTPAGLWGPGVLAVLAGAAVMFAAILGALASMGGLD